MSEVLRFFAASSQRGGTMRLICPVCCESVVADGSGMPAEVACPRCGSSFPPQKATVVDGAAAAQAYAETRSWKESGQRGGALPHSLPQIPGYDVIEFVARGGMGMVIKARHTVLDRLVAIKMPLPHQIADEADRTRFLREARSAARLRHPNICPIYEVGQHEGRPYLAMGFIQGETLRDWAKAKQPTARQAAEMVATLARAVGYAHQHSVIHRDIKPSNVMVDAETGQPVLMDFGLAKELTDQSSQVTRAGQVMGTPAYMAPEQAAGRLDRVGPHSDVYALGAVLYELLCDRPPFLGSAGEVLQQVQSEEPAPPRRLVPRVHRDLETICLKALAKDPAVRYASAAELADDLDRFSAGEAILARRPGPIGRLWRKARRSPVTAASLVAVMVAAVAAGFVAVRATQVYRVTVATSALEAGLDTRDWTAEHLERLEALVETLERLEPEQAAPARERLYERFAESITAELQRPTLQPDDIRRIEASLDLLGTRKPELLPKLRRDLEERLLRREPVFELAAPFENLGSIFEAGQVAVDGQIIRLRDPPGDRPSVGVLTRVACQGNVQLEALIAERWSAASQIGLVLSGHDPKGGAVRKGYTFLLQAPPGVATGSNEAVVRPFDAVRRTGGVFSLQIVRSGVRLREQQVPASDIPDGPLRLTASRDGERLRFQVNELPPLEFQDAFPLGGSALGAFGLEWPVAGRLERLSASRQALPVAASPLQRGDDFYARGQLTEALAFYREQAIASAGTPAAQEARAKEGLCLVALNRLSESAPIFAEVAAEPGPRWPVVAACQLWMLYLREKRTDEADAVFDSLASRYRYAELASLIPADVRDPIIAAHRSETFGLAALRYNPNRVRNIERADAVEELLGAPDHSRIWTKWALLRASRGAGQNALAQRTVDDMIRLEQRMGMVSSGFAMEYSWLSRERGDFERARQLVNQRLVRTESGYREELLPLLVERARLFIDENQPEKAEESVEEFFRLIELDRTRYYYLADASLVRGFLRAERGDEAGAMEAWREGCFKSNPTTADPSTPADGTEILYATILGSLTGQLTDEQSEAFLSRALLSQTGDSPAGMLRNAFRFPPSVLQNMWRTPRGREFARQIAYRKLPFAGVYRAVVAVLVAETLHDGALPGDLSPEHDELIWKLADGYYDAQSTGKLTDANLVQLALAWKGNMSLLGWAGVAQTLEPALRGPTAYLAGHRYRRLGKPADAAKLFQTALADAPPDSTLARLAQTELER